MEERQRAKIVLEKWRSALTKENRKHNNLDYTFDELVYSLLLHKVGFNLAREVLEDAVAHMMPEKEVMKKVWANSPAKKWQSQQEHAKKWIADIEKIALNIFYGYYTLEEPENTTDVPSHTVAPQKVKSTKPARKPARKPLPSGPKSDDELNAQDFWSNVRSITKDSPWLFADKEDDDGKN